VEGCDKVEERLTFSTVRCTSGQFLVSRWKDALDNGKYVNELICMSSDTHASAVWLEAEGYGNISHGQIYCKTKWIRLAIIVAVGLLLVGAIVGVVICCVLKKKKRSTNGA
ncbi:hypothetical protein PFISCL1PPCAC_5089, partial [Pristionchus fissidentatus]